MRREQHNKGVETVSYLLFGVWLILRLRDQSVVFCVVFYGLKLWS